MKKLQISNISNSDWKDLFEALTGQSNFKVVMDNKGGLLFETKDASFSKKLQQIIASPEGIQSQLKFALKNTNQTDSHEEKKFEPRRPVTIVDGYNIFTRLLDYCEGKTKKSLSFDWDPVGFDYLFEDVSEVSMLVPLRKAAVEVLSSIIKKLSYAQLYAVLPTGEFKVLPITLKNKTEGPLASMIEKILFFDELKKFVVFDYSLFINCLTPPEAKIQENLVDRTFHVHFPSAMRLHNFLRTSLGSDFIIKAITSGEEKTGHMIILGDIDTSTPGISRSNHFYYALDCSQSMNYLYDQNRTKDVTIFPEVLKTSKGIVGKLNAFSSSSTQLSVFPIKGPMDPITCQDYKIAEEKSLQNCERFLDSLKADSGTNLYGVLYAVFQRIKQHPEENHCVMAITDGEDQNDEPLKGKLFQQLTEICQSFQTLTTPQVFIVTIGRNVATDLTRKLSQAINATIIEVENHTQIDQLYGYFRQMHLPMKIIDVLIKMHDGIKAQERVSVFAGHPRSVTSMVVKDGDTVQFRDSSYTVSFKSSLNHNKVSDKSDNLWGQHRPRARGAKTIVEYPPMTRRHSR